MPDTLRWSAFASKLVTKCCHLFASSEVAITARGKADRSVLALLLLARTLSNLKAVLVLIRERQIVEARIIVRCLFENQFWCGRLMTEEGSFVEKMVAHEMKHKRLHGELLMYQAKAQLGEEAESAVRDWLRDNKQWAEVKTLTPKDAVKGEMGKSYVFYSALSTDSHPSIETLSRYYEEGDSEGIAAIVVEPALSDEEVVETLNLACLAGLSVCLLVDEMLGEEPGGCGLHEMADQYSELTRLTKVCGN